MAVLSRYRLISAAAARAARFRRAAPRSLSAAIGVVALLALLLAPAALAAGWAGPIAIDQTNNLSSVSCPSSSFCTAVDLNGNALTFNGSVWSAPTDVGGTPSSVSCPSAAFCAAVDTNGNLLTFNGGSWTAPSSGGGPQLNSVSCPSASFCAAVDVNGDATIWNGSAWGPLTATGAQGALRSVSCPSASFCVAVAAGGSAVSWNGGGWTARDIDGSATLVSVSCPSSAFCVAVDDAGNALTFSGGRWSAPAAIDSTGTLEAVSCASSAFCVAVDSNDDALTWTGFAWSAPTVVSAAGTAALVSVSCSTALFCAAVDSNGNAYLYHGEPGGGAGPGSASTPAHVYWTNGTLWIGRADANGRNVRRAFIHLRRYPASGIAVDANFIYWTENGPKRGTGTIGRARLNGTGVDEHFIRDLDGPIAVAVDAGDIYWANGATAPWIGRANIHGGQVQPHFINATYAPDALAVDSAHIYWANYYRVHGISNWIGRATLAGHLPNQQWLFTGDGLGGTGVSVDASHVYWSAVAFRPQTAGGVRRAVPCCGRFGRAALSGHPVLRRFLPVPQALGSEPTGMTVFGDFLYWSDAGTNAIGLAEPLPALSSFCCRTFATRLIHNANHPGVSPDDVAAGN